MNLFLFFLNAISLAGQSVLHLFFVCRFTEKPFRLYYFVFYFSLLCAIEQTASFFSSNGDIPFYPIGGAPDWPQTAAAAVEFVLLYSICRFFSGNSPAPAVIATILAYYVSRLSFGIVNSLESLLLPGFAGKTLLYILVILSVFTALALCTGCYALIFKCFSFQNGQPRPCLCILFPSFVFFFAVEYLMVYAIYGQNTIVLPAAAETGKHLIVLLLQSLGMAALISTLLAYKWICRGFYAQSALTSMTRELNTQKTYVAQAQMRYEKTRSFRHDVKNHLSVLNGLLKSGNTIQAVDYLEKLDTATADLSFPFHTGNPVVDIVLGDKLQLAMANNIRLEVSLLIPPKCQIDDLDLCVIFTNALDNALHACKELEKDAFIRVTGHCQGSFYMLKFENTCLPNPFFSIGTGLSNIKAVAEKYGGSMAAELSGSRFHLNVLLNISIQPGSRSRPFS